MASNKILVIDDTTVVRVKVREMLSPYKFEVLEAKDGLEGLHLIQQEKLSLIMLDFLLPKMSGWEVFQKIQAAPELRKIPLVVMSGSKQEVTEKIHEPFAHFEFLGKPFDQKQLIGAIKSAMAKVPSEPPKPETPPQQSPDTVITSTVGTVSTAEINALNEKILKLQTTSTAEANALNEKIVKLQAEVEGLKKQLTQVVTFIKQKIK